MKTNKDLKIMKGSWSAMPGSYWEVPKGSPVEYRKRSNPTQGSFVEYFVSPSVFPAGSIDRHDAVHYGCRVSEHDIKA